MQRPKNKTIGSLLRGIGFNPILWEQYWDEYQRGEYLSHRDIYDDVSLEMSNLESSLPAPAHTYIWFRDVLDISDYKNTVPPLTLEHAWEEDFKAGIDNFQSLIDWIEHVENIKFDVSDLRQYDRSKMSCIDEFLSDYGFDVLDPLTDWTYYYQLGPVDWIDYNSGEWSRIRDIGIREQQGEYLEYTPISVLEDGSLIDGAHRIAWAAYSNQRSIPALVGVPELYFDFEDYSQTVGGVPESTINTIDYREISQRIIFSIEQLATDDLISFVANIVSSDKIILHNASYCMLYRYLEDNLEGSYRDSIIASFLLYCLSIFYLEYGDKNHLYMASNQYTNTIPVYNKLQEELTETAQLVVSGFNPLFDEASQRMDSLNFQGKSQTEIIDEMLSLREYFIGKYACAIPDDYSIGLLATFSPLIEIGAGLGYWASLIQELGGTILPYDNLENILIHRVNQPYYTEVYNGEPEILKDVGPEYNLFLCYPPPSDMAYRALSYFKGEYVIFVGMADARFIANQPFFDMLDANFNLIEEINLLSWTFITSDRMFIYERR